MELSIGPRPKQNILLLSSFQSSTFTSMSSSDSFAKFHTEAALSLFCKIAVEVISEQGVKGVPSDYELHGLIMKKVFTAEEHSSPVKSIPRSDDTAVEVEVSETLQVEEPKVSSLSYNLTSKD